MAGQTLPEGTMQQAMTSARRPRVVIVGGGFGGLAAAKTLRRAPVDVVLIHRTNHHLLLWREADTSTLC